MAKAMLIMDMPSSCLHCSCSNIVHGRSRCEDKDFSEQMENDGICDEILDKVYDTFDSFLASNFMDIAELEG